MIIDTTALNTPNIYLNYKHFYQKQFNTTYFDEEENYKLFGTRYNVNSNKIMSLKSWIGY